jgi:hypothetical protein
LLILGLPLGASTVTLNDIAGSWKGGSYLFVLGRNYTATVVIYINQYEAYVFSGIYNIEKNDVLNISIREMKSGPQSEVLSKKGFSRTASSRFAFYATINKSKGKSLILRPKEIIIDGNNSEGYFEKELTLGQTR